MHSAYSYGKRHKTIECPSVRPPVCLSRRSKAAMAVGGFAAEVGRGSAADIDRYAGHVNFGPTV